MNASSATIERLRPFLNRERMVETATAMIGVPSPTGNAGAVSDRLAEILQADGFDVERPDGAYPESPAVAVRLVSATPGKTIQFNGHLDTVHLPFVPPAIEGETLTGSGAADMKGGTAAAIEALRILRDANALPAGAVLFTAHDLHESPWGDGRQLDALIREGYVGDAVLLPEPLTDTLPVIGRGLAVWKIAIRRPGPPVHEVMRPPDTPSVITAGAALVAELDRLNATLAASSTEAMAPGGPGPASAFIGQFHAGEIFNQSANVCHLEGTRRWLPGTDHREVERDFRAIVDRVAREHRADAQVDWFFTRDAFYLDETDRFVGVFREAFEAGLGRPIPTGPKPFVDDGNSFWALAGIPAITHGPRAAGQHTLQEWISIDDMERVALLYAATAIAFCINA